MNWTWTIRSTDAGMNGLEFCRVTTAGGWRRVLVHAAPGRAQVEVRDESDVLIASGTVDRDGQYTPMTMIDLTGDGVQRNEVWPGPDHVGLPVLLAGGEAGILREWHDSDGHRWWRWTLELSNHSDRPSDWSPATEARNRPERRAD